jgi:hypothetical protein
MDGGDSFETCPTDVVHAPVERVWELLTIPSLITWADARLIEAPGRGLVAGDRIVFVASLGLRVSWTVLSLDPPKELALQIGLPFGMGNRETIVLSRLAESECRVTFN